MNTTNTRYSIIGLTIATALIHLVLSGGSNVLFILNGIGFLGLLGLIYLPLSFMDGKRAMAKWALAGFALITIIAYFIINPERFSSPLGLITKVIELALLILLVKDNRG